ncbi:MAG: UBP-type zinc finger domain-containing protein [Acidobacteria bacterium]|nr:UBP-type zinc finger domain-containing protein [Acidobacteriota bacterium]
MKKESCQHLPTGAAAPRASKCEECGSSSSVRVCLSCGHVGCCDSTRGHATAHYRDSGHPIIRELPISPGSFTWCYECGAYVR